MRWTLMIGGLVGAAGVALVARGVANSRRLDLTHETVALPDLPEPFDGFRILFFTDIHLRRHSARAAQLIGLAHGVQPDLICLGGDYAYTALSARDVERLLTALCQRWPTVGVFGNADFRPDITQQVRDRWAACVQMLANSALRLERGDASLWLAGVDDPHTGRDSLPHAMACIPPNHPVLLLAHSPAVVLRAFDPRVRLVLSGHTHGGQICLPDGRAIYANMPLPTRFASGRHSVHGAVLYVSRGIGSTRIPVRFGCLPEAVLVTLRCGETA